MAWRRQFDIAAASLEGDPARLNLCCPHQFVFSVTAPGLKQAVYSQRDAIFRGGEFQSQWDIAPLWAGVFGLESQFDLVRATFTDGTNVPRIPPARVGGGVFYRDGSWLARMNLLHAFAQNNITDVETPTPGQSGEPAWVADFPG